MKKVVKGGMVIMWDNDVFYVLEALMTIKAVPWNGLYLAKITPDKYTVKPGCAWQAQMGQSGTPVQNNVKI